MKNEILESLRPWDCEIFDKDPCSPFICYCGGGGGPKPPKIKPPSLPVPQLPPTPTFNDPLQNINLTPSQGNLDSLASMGSTATRNLDSAIGLESGFGSTTQGAMSGMTNEINSGLAKFNENLDRSDLNIANWAPGSGSNNQQGQASSANYSGSKKKGKQASSQEGTMGKKKERLQKRESLKVRKK